MPPIEARAMAGTRDAMILSAASERRKKSPDHRYGFSSGQEAESISTRSQSASR
jgi:hypothetical protein